MSLILPHRSGMYRRRFVGGLLAVVAFGVIAVAPTHFASATNGPGNAGTVFNVQPAFETIIDTDGDGASDESEIAFGSDPNDARDYPEVQAGPEDGDGTTAEEAAVVTALPNTGAQPLDDDDSSMLLLLLSGAIAAGGLAGTQRLRNTR